MDPDSLFSYRTVALENAIELCDDAKILLSQERWARCYFLIQIATEELGKYGIIISSSISLKHGSITYKEFLKRFRDHREKIKNLLTFEDFSDFILTEKKDRKLINIEENNKYADMQEETKLKALYSDFDDDGKLKKPSEIIGKEMCLISMKLLENRIKLFKSFEEEIASVISFKKFTKESINKFRKK